MPFIFGGVCSLLTLVGFYFSPPGGELWKVVFNRGLALFAIWVTAILTFQRKNIEQKREEAILEREEALKQVKVLQGFIPICASCKKIRDDKGYWDHLETYITRHSQAVFSHSICPECVKKLYPDLEIKSAKENIEP